MPEKYSYTEEELISALRLKQKHAFEHLYDMYAPTLNGILFKITNNHEISQDLLQETFLKIWKNIDLYNSSKGRLFTWMLSISRNLAIDYMRSKDFKKLSKTESSTNFVNHDEGEVLNVDSIGIKKSLSNLKDESREVLDLAYFYGYTHEQISEITNMPLGTVKTKLRAAIKELRKFLD